MGTNVLIIGGGAREHALAWKLAQSPRIGKLWCSPGNAGTKELGENIPRMSGERWFTQMQEIAERDSAITIVGPEAPLADGIADLFRGRNLPIFGPTMAAAQIEWSKPFAKKIMQQEGISTPRFMIVKRDGDSIKRGVEGLGGPPIVIKAPGLAEGKGVFICKTGQEVENTCLEFDIARLLQMSKEVVIEEYVEGQEISMHALADGKTSLLFPASRDHKRLTPDPTSPNTGGMGAYAPLEGVMLDPICDNIVKKVLAGLAYRGSPFQGLLYPGLIQTAKGISVLEFNARFGDPEAQVYMRLLETDLLDLVESTINGTLGEIDLRWKLGYAVCVVLASRNYGYALHPPFSGLITGIEEAREIPGVEVFHGATRLTEIGELVNGTGRVLSVTATGETLSEAHERAYCAVGRIDFPGVQFRADIGRSIH